MKLGAQLYTLRSFIQNEQDIALSLEKVARMGYRSVQISAMGPIRPEKLRALCDRSNLEIGLTHTAAERILYDTENVIREHRVLGCRYIGLGCMPEKYRDEHWLAQFPRDFRDPARKIAQAGMKLMYHNHNFEFQRFDFLDGRRILDYLADSFSPEEMGFTLDTYWVQAGGADILDVIDWLGDRIPCVHYKDMAVKGFTPVMAACMEGNINFRKITSRLAALGKTEFVFVEQDDCGGKSPFACLKTSYDNLMSLGHFE